MIIAHVTKNALASQSRKLRTYSRNEEEKISDEEEDSYDESDDDVDIMRELLENLSQKESEQVEEEDTSSGEEEYVVRVIFPGGSTTELNYKVGKTGQTKRHSGFCVLLLTSPTKFCRKLEKLNLNLIGTCQIPCFTEEYVHNSIKKNEYVFLKILSPSCF